MPHNHESPVIIKTRSGRTMSPILPLNSRFSRLFFRFFPHIQGFQGYFLHFDQIQGFQGFQG